LSRGGIYGVRRVPRCTDCGGRAVVAYEAVEGAVGVVGEGIYLFMVPFGFFEGVLK
jgi:hypothetical protein